MTWLPKVMIPEELTSHWTSTQLVAAKAPGAGRPGAALPGSIHEVDGQRYADLAHEMDLYGPGRVRNMGPRPGSGRSVTTGNRAHAPDNASDRRAPHRPNQVYPDVEDHGMGGTEEVTRRHGEYFGQLRGKVPGPTVGHGSKMIGWPVGSGR